MHPSPRINAFLIHLLASVIVALMALALVFGVWYPAPLQKAVGVTQIYFLVILVDLVVGPLLTLIIYKPGKKSLKFDLTVIVYIQLAALTYGLSSVAEGRPVWLVYSVDRFDLVQALQLDTRNLHRAKEQFRDSSWTGPRWAAARRPSDPVRDRDILFETLSGGADISQRPDLYVPLEDEAEVIRKCAYPIEELLRFNSLRAVSAVRDKWPNADSFLPMKGRVADLTVLIEKQASKVVAIVDLKPWK